MSTTKTNPAEKNTPTIRIIYRGECPKLTPRGKDTLSYEFGIDSGSMRYPATLAYHSLGIASL
jgi:hypothetical protein